MQAVAIYDNKARAFMLPMFFSHIDVARRSFADAVNTESQFSRNPEDFTLFHIGEWNDEHGIFSGHAHVNLGLAATYKRS